MTRIMLVCGFTLLLQTAVAQVPANPYALAIDGRDGSLLLAHRDTLLLRSTPSRPSPCADPLRRPHPHASASHPALSRLA